MHMLNIVTSLRKETFASNAVAKSFLTEYGERVRDVTVDVLDVWQEQHPEFDAEVIDVKFKGV
jgi:FMN-dependent NADH-azoreductase